MTDGKYENDENGPKGSTDSKLTTDQFLELVKSSNLKLPAKSFITELLVGERVSNDSVPMIVPRSEHYGTRIDSNLPKFGGKRNENVMQWITLAKDSLLVSRIKEEHMCQAISLYLEGSALQTYLSYRHDKTEKQQDLSFLEFSGILLNQFDDKMSRLNARTKLQYLKHTVSFEEYLKTFKSLAINSELPEDVKIQFFVNGLKEKTKVKLLSESPGTLEEAFNIASIYENTIFSAKEKQSKTEQLNYASNMQMLLCH
jgi:hypothetical protein